MLIPPTESFRIFQVTYIHRCCISFEKNTEKNWDHLVHLNMFSFPFSVSSDVQIDKLEKTIQDISFN
jgi:hypothetical protein